MDELIGIEPNLQQHPRSEVFRIGWDDAVGLASSRDSEKSDLEAQRKTMSRRANV